MITNTGVGPSCPQENPRTAIRAKEWVTGTVGSKAANFRYGYSKGMKKKFYK